MLLRFWIGLMVFTSLSACSRVVSKTLKAEDLPTVVQTTFEELYPSVKEVAWEQEGKNYEAEFEAEGTEMEVLIDAKGKLIYTETEIETTQLPETIQKQLNKNYGSYTVAEIDEILDKTKGLRYEVELEKEKQLLTLLFNEEGKLFKEEKEKPKKEVEVKEIERRLYPY